MAPRRLYGGDFGHSHGAGIDAVSGMLAAARRYADNQWAVFPLRSNSKLPATEHGWKDATTDEGQIHAWFDDGRPCNVGIATGHRSGLLVIDVDRKKKVDGFATLARLEAELGSISDTRTVTTPSGGAHLYFLVDQELRCSTGTLGPGIDVRADGGYVVAPPSVITATEYRWEDDGPILPLPLAWIARIQHARSGGGDFHELDAQPVPIGQQEDVLNRRTCSLRRGGVSRTAAAAGLWADVQKWEQDRTRPWTLADVEAKVERAWRDIEPKSPLATSGRGALRTDDDPPAVSTAMRIGPRVVPTVGRSVTLVSASGIKPRPVKWLDDGRVPLSSLTLLGGREGVGKSILAATMAAAVTRGTLPGVYHGHPKSVIVVATEDSWEKTIVPRLMAAGADLGRVFRVDVASPEGLETVLSLPEDLPGLERAVKESDTALVVLDPLLSRLSDRLDTHVDAQVRRALEPLVALADRTAASILGLIHVNKTVTTDPLTGLMGSRAFAAVARSVIYMTTDPDNPEARLVGIPKNNLGRTDLPTRSCRIEGAKVAVTDEGEVWTGRLVWTGTRSQSIHEVLEAAAETPNVRTATSEAEMWLEDYLSAGQPVPSAKVKEDGHRDGHSADALKRAASRLRVVISAEAFPRRTVWSLGRGPAPTAPTGEHMATTNYTVGVVGAVSAGSPARSREASVDEQVLRLRELAAFNGGRIA